MSGLRPFWRYFGGKWAAVEAGWYPAPRYDAIIEPFAGAAGYACHWPDRRVILVERNPKVAAIWRYLIAVDPAEVLAIPDIPEGGTVDDLPCCQEARWLAGFWLNEAGVSPCTARKTGWGTGEKHRGINRKANVGWGRNGMYDWGGWGDRTRSRLARQVPRIRHWRIIEGTYQDAPEVEATWFVDPPYAVAGKHYPFHDIDYPALGGWCRSRRGQVMVCENAGADWLPFVPMARIKGTSGKGRKGTSDEVVWPGEGTQVSMWGSAGGRP